jgi:hypothetical protein
VGRLPRELSGTYWTDRLTSGDFTFHLVDRKVDYASLDAVAKAELAKREEAAKQATKEQAEAANKPET